MGRKICFLDVDGVINSQELAKELGWGGHFNEEDTATHHNVAWGQEMVDRVKSIVEETGAQIVMSSTWRKYFSIEKFKEMFALYGWENAPVIDKTPSGYKIRGLEVNRWLKDNPDVEKYVILDDYPDFMPQQKEYFVNTNAEIGLTEEDKIKAITILNK